MFFWQCRGAVQIKSVWCSHTRETLSNGLSSRRPAWCHELTLQVERFSENRVKLRMTQTSMLFLKLAWCQGNYPRLSLPSVGVLWYWKKIQANNLCLCTVARIKVCFAPSFYDNKKKTCQRWKCHIVGLWACMTSRQHSATKPALPYYQTQETVAFPSPNGPIVLLSSIVHRKAIGLNR